MIFYPRKQGGILQFIFWADLDTNAAHAPSADVLEMLLHVSGTFFRVEIPFPIPRRLFAVNCPRRAGAHAGGTLPATVFNDGQFALQRHICEDRGEAELTAKLIGEE